MIVKVLFFGVLSDITKTMSINIESKKDTDELIKYIESEYPEIKKYKYKISILKTNQINVFMNLTCPFLFIFYSSLDFYI